MADFSALKTSIQNYIKQNGNEEITGNLLQQILLSMVSTLGDSAINDLVTALNAEIANRGNADTELGGSITTLQGVVNGIKSNVENGYVYAGIATPSTTPVSGKVFYLALNAGTYTNFGATVVPQGINILKYNGSAWSLDSFLGLDDTPTQGSNNLVKSGGVLDSIIKDGSAFDLSAYNSGATYADLSAALTALNDLPAAYKKGGMSVKFVLTSDNKYVQYRLMASGFTTTVTEWQGVDDEPTAGSKNLLESEGVFNELRVKELEIGGSVDIPISEFVAGNAINTSGTLTPDDGRMITSFVKVIEGTIVTWNELQTNAQQLSVACYDASKNLISGSSTSQGSGQLTVDNTIKYIRFNARTNQTPSVNLLNQDSTNNRIILIDDETIIKEGTAVSSGDYLAYYLTETDIKRGKIQIQFSSSLNKVGVLYVYNKDYTKTYADGVGIEQNLSAGTYTFTLSPNADYLRLASDFGDTLTYKISYNGKLSEIKNELSQVEKKSNTVQSENVIKEGIATYSDDYVEYYLNDFEKNLKRIFVKFSRTVASSNPVTVYIYNTNGTKTLAENWNTQYLFDGVYGFILEDNAQYIRLAGNNGEDINYSIYYEGEIYGLTRSMSKCFRLNTVHFNKSYTGTVDADELFNGIEQGDIIKLSIKGTVSNLTAYLDNQYHNQSEVVRFGRNNHINKAGDYYCIATYKNLIDLRLYSAATDNNFSVELSTIGKLDEHSLSDSIKTMSRCIQINDGFTQTSAHECSIAFDKQFGYICVVYIGYDWTITGTPSYGESANNFYLSYFPLWNPQNKKTMVIPIGNRYDPNIISLGNGVFRIVANNLFRDGNGAPTERTIQRCDFDIKTETLTEWVDVLMTLSGNDVVCSYTNYAAYLDENGVSHTDTRTGDELFYQKWIGVQTAMHQESNVIYSALNSYLNPSVLIQSTDNFETVVPYAVLNKPEIRFEMDYYKNNNKLYAIYRCADGIKYITSSDNGATWSNATLFPCSSQSRPNIVKYKGLPLFIIPAYYEISTLYPNIDNNLDTNTIDFYYGEEVNMTDLVHAKQLISKYGFDYPKAFVLLDDIYVGFGEGRMAFGLWNNTICSAKEMISWLYLGEII